MRVFLSFFSFSVSFSLLDFKISLFLNDEGKIIQYYKGEEWSTVVRKPVNRCQTPSEYTHTHTHTLLYIKRERLRERKRESRIKSNVGRTNTMTNLMKQLRVCILWIKKKKKARGVPLPKRLEEIIIVSFVICHGE